MTHTEFSTLISPISEETDTSFELQLDKRLIGERNRIAVLTWLARFGWLTSRMLSCLIWSDAAQPLTMSRRTIKMLGAEKLVIARALPKGGAAYLLSAKGARLLKEQTGISAASGNSLALGNTVHRATSNWYLIHAIQRGFSVVTEHEIATEQGPCRFLRGKQADGLVIADDGACIWIECENSAKSRPERHKTVALVEATLGHKKQVEIAPGLFLAKVAIVATNEQALRWMAASFLEAHRDGKVQESQISEIEVCLMHVSESLVPGEAIEGNLWWDVIWPAIS